MSEISKAYLLFACGIRENVPLAFESPKGLTRKRDGAVRFCVYDADPKAKNRMPVAPWPGKPNPKWPDRKTNCFINCPVEELKLKKLAGRRVERHFGRDEKDGTKLYHYVTCHTRLVKE